MTSHFERVFEVSVPVQRVWDALTDADLRAEMATPPDDDDGISPPRSDGPSGLRGLESDPPHRLRWANEDPRLPERAEFTVVLESTATGTRIVVTRYGFGEGDEADVFGEANALGMVHGFMELVAYLETGQILKRHYDGCTRSCTGIMYSETPAGLLAHRVEPGTFGAAVGIRGGDLLVRLAGAAVLHRSDMWALLQMLPAGDEVEISYVRQGALRSGSAALSPISMRAVGE